MQQCADFLQSKIPRVVAMGVVERLEADHHELFSAVTTCRVPETEMVAAQQKLESLRELVASTPILLATSGEEVQVTISAGLATFPQDGESTAELFALADDRMFQAKEEGRNRVVAGDEVVLS